MLDTNGNFDWPRIVAQAETGDAKAQFYVGMAYAQGGECVEPDPAAAVGWFRRAAAQGMPLAAIELGKCYVRGVGVAADRSEGRRWFKQAADSGFPAAHCELALTYALPAEDADPVKLVEGLSYAAQAGYLEAQFLLGIVYHTGRDAEKDTMQAVRWLKEAAAADLVEAKFVLGMIYLYELNNYADALYWNQLAAEQDSAPAQYNLAYQYENGLGVEPNLTIALQWYRKCHAAGDGEMSENAALAIAELEPVIDAENSPP